MSLRVLAVTMFVLALSAYAWRDWFRSLCGALILMAFLEHPDMPRKILGIQGFNLWNVLFTNVLLAWLSQRSSEGLVWDMPKSLRIAFVLYGAVVIWGFLRLLMDPTSFYEGDTASIFMDYLVNPIKFLLPCFMLYDGCRSRERVLWATSAILLYYFLLSLQVIRYMGLHFDTGEALSRRAAKILTRTVGYHRVDLSMMLAGASWAAFAFSRCLDSRLLRWAVWGAAATIFVGQAMTGGRTGYATWGIIGLILCVLKWRKLLPLIPIAAIIVVLFVPAVRERMFAGFGGDKGAIHIESDSSEITSGRSVIWPYVIQKIKEAPVIGYGRLAMVRTGLYDWLLEELGEVFMHPHNAYLEMLFDNGVLGFLCVVPLFWIVFGKCVSLFRNREDLIFDVSGGMALALLLALLIAGMGAQTFYAREGVVGMWAAIGVAMRTWVVQKELSQGDEHPLSDSANDQTTDSSGGPIYHFSLSAGHA